MANPYGWQTQGGPPPNKTLPPDWAENPYGYPGSPGYDPSSAGFQQPFTLSPRGAQRSFFTSGAPQRLDEFRRFAEPKIRDATHGAFLAQMETLTGQQRESQRRTGDQFATMGLSPGSYHANVATNQNQQLAEALAALRGGAISAEAQGNIDLRGQILNSLNQVESYYDSLKLQNFLASKGRAAARDAQHAGTLNAVIGALGGAAAGYLGGPAMGAG